MNSCKICDCSFASERGLHLHISKKHSITLPEYYTTYYPRLDGLTGKKLHFKNKFDYFNIDFQNRGNMIKWCQDAPEEEVREYILKQLKNRIEQKELSFAPSHLELELRGLPPLDLYRKFFKGYTNACNELKIKPLFSEKIMNGFFDIDPSLENIKIFIDTREQKPLKFQRSSSMKLDFGDYAVGGKEYDYTYVDRKSESDFKSTMTIGFERFRKELQRAKEFNAYLFVVVESSIAKIKKNNIFAPHKSNLAFVWNRMRLLSHEFAGSCQFVFSGSRKDSQALIPKLLVHGKALWGVDVQYYIDKELNDLGCREAG